MSEQLVRPEVARSFENLLGFRGGVAPNSSQELVPVVIIDDNSKGPYPAHRVWHFGANIGPGGVGIFAAAGVMNNDPIGQRSAVVVDRIFLRSFGVTATDFLVGITPIGTPPLADAPSSDANVEKDPAAQVLTDNRIGNVSVGQTLTNNVTILNSLFPGQPVGQMYEVPGPFIFGPKSQFLVVANTAQAAFSFWVRGRYYPAI